MIAISQISRLENAKHLLTPATEDATSFHKKRKRKTEDAICEA